MYGGTGAGGAIFPLIVSALLKGVGYKATMISLGVSALIVGNICILFIKRRIPLPSRSHAAAVQGLAERRHKKVDWSFLKRKTFYAGVMTIFITSLGNFVPSVWLPSEWHTRGYETAGDRDPAYGSFRERPQPHQPGRNGFGVDHEW